MLVDWIANVGVLSLGALGYYFLVRRGVLRLRRTARVVLLGAIFGLLSVLVVMMPVHLNSGATFDMRAGPAVLSGFFLGPIGGLITGVLAAMARISVGGPFVYGGAVSMFAYAMFGALCGYFWRKTSEEPGLWQLIVLALAATLVAVPCLFIDQGVAVGLSVLARAWHMLLLGNLFGVVVLGLMVGEARKFAREHVVVKDRLHMMDMATATAGIGLWRFDLSSKKIEWDEAMFDIFNVTPEDFGGGLKDWEQLVHPKDIDEVNERFYRAAATGKAFEHEYRVQLPNGDVRWILSHCDFLKEENGEIREAIGVYRDITDEKKLQVGLKAKEKEARQRSADLEATLGSVVQGVAAFNADGRLRFCNQRTGFILGLGCAELKAGTHIDVFNRYREGAKVSHFVAGRESEGGDAEAPDLKTGQIRSLLTLKSGRVLSFSSAPMPDGGWVETYEDVTEKAIADRRVRQAAETDALTGLANRLSFNRELRNALTRAQEEQVSDQILMLIDINDFKDVNDTHGHVIGDRLLIAIGKLLGRFVEEGTVIARLGGDEFALILKMHDKGKLEAVARNICDAFDGPIDLDGVVVRTGISIGAAYILPEYAEVERALSRADIALYKAKATPGTGYRIYDAKIASEEAQRRRIKTDLIQVVRDRGLEVHCQPIFNFAKQEVDHFEALVRWRKGGSENIPPSSFIPIAEEIGLIRDVGEFVLSEVFRFLSRWPTPISAGINVSVLQLGAGSFVDLVRNGLEEYGVAPGRIEIEVTESVLMEEESAAQKDLIALRDMGLKLTLDDFGMGFSSLSYLQQFPFDKLKIDKKFVSEVDTSAGSAAIVRTIASLAESLNMSCTAEGVETQSQMDFVRECGCASAQGFFIGQPIALDDLTPALLRGRNQTVRRLASA